MIDIENNIIIHHLLSGFKFSHSIKRRPVSSSKFLTTNLHFLRMTSSSLSLSLLWYIYFTFQQNFHLLPPLAIIVKTQEYIFKKKNSFLQNNSESLLIFSIIPVEVKRGKARQLFVNNYLFRVMHPTTQLGALSQKRGGNHTKAAICQLALIYERIVRKLSTFRSDLVLTWFVQGSTPFWK